MVDETEIWTTAAALLKGWPDKALDGVAALFVENIQSGDWGRALMWQAVYNAMSIMPDRSKAN